MNATDGRILEKAMATPLAKSMAAFGVVVKAILHWTGERPFKKVNALREGHLPYTPSVAYLKPYRLVVDIRSYDKCLGELRACYKTLN